MNGVLEVRRESRTLEDFCESWHLKEGGGVGSVGSDRDSEELVKNKIRISKVNRVGSGRRCLFPSLASVLSSLGLALSRDMIFFPLFVGVGPLVPNPSTLYFHLSDLLGVEHLLGVEPLLGLEPLLRVKDLLDVELHHLSPSLNLGLLNPSSGLKRWLDYELELIH